MYGGLLEKSLEEFKERWNSHSIRRSRLANCLAGVPDDLYNLPQINGMQVSIDIIAIIIIYGLTLVLGTYDYKKELSFDAWTYSYCRCATQPLPFFPPEFQAAATAIMQVDLGMCKEDITANNAEQIYTHLVRIIG